MKYKLKSTASSSRILLLLFATLFVRLSIGQISIAALPFNPGVTNFNAYNPNSAGNLTATIPAGWTAASSGTPVYNGQGNGSSATGGYWGYGAAADFSLGALHDATAGNITYTLSFVNNSGTTITSMTLGWDYEQWRFANTSGLDCSGTGGLAGNATLNAKDFTGTATGTNGTGVTTTVPVFTLTGLSIANGAAFGITWVTTDPAGNDNGVSLDNFSIAICNISPTIVLGANPNVCKGTTSVNLAYTNPLGSPNQYSIDYNTAANSAGFVDVVNAPLLPTNIGLVVPAAANVGDYAGVLTVKNSAGGCVSVPYNIIVHVISCAAPYMTWVPLQPGESHGSCVSTTNCTPSSGNVICYGLQYTPNHNGNMTSYTTGFFVDCANGNNPIISNHTCSPTPPGNDNSQMDDGCSQFGLVLMNCSANTLSVPVNVNVPIIIHQVCLAIPSPLSINLGEDMTTGYTTSIDLTGGGFVSEFPTYSTYAASWDQNCVTLPLHWLEFSALRYAELMSQIDWTTTDEINTSYFEIQRSNDNTRNFVTIGTVNAASISEPVNTYQFIDRKAMVGKNYYRIKQVDFDGKYEFSPARTVTFTSGVFNVTAWPNPASSDVTISINHADESGQITLIDLTGKPVFNQDFDRGTSDHALTVDHLQPGMYTLLVTSGDNRYVEKIVVMH